MIARRILRLMEFGAVFVVGMFVGWMANENGQR